MERRSGYLPGFHEENAPLLRADSAEEKAPSGTRGGLPANGASMDHHPRSGSPNVGQEERSHLPAGVPPGSTWEKWASIHGAAAQRG